MGMASAAIEIEALTKDYPIGFWQAKKRRALDGLSLRVEAGEILGFLGPNGAGKTTTLKLLMGLIFPTSGSARILGQPISDVDVRRKIGFLPEQPHFYDYLTAPELLDYFARFFGMRAAERRERVDRFLKKVGLDGARKIQLRKYSKGMLQRAGLAQAILHDPEVVILDEPMSGLDPVGRREAREIILDLKREGRTILFSTHILSDAEMICDRVAVVVNGKLRGVGSPEQIVSVKAPRMEILFELRDARSVPAAFADKAEQIGNRRRIEVAEADLYAALEQLKTSGASVLSVTQIKPTLEDYFLDLLGAERAASHAVEVSDK